MAKTFWVLLKCHWKGGLTFIGQKGREVYETFSFENRDNEMKFVPVLEEFFEYCNPRKSITILHHKFFYISTTRRSKLPWFYYRTRKTYFRMSIWNTLWLVNKEYDCLWHKQQLFERTSSSLIRITLPNAISAVHAAKETCKDTCEILKSNENCQSTQDFKTFKI